jgi:hypothetical protein
MLKNVNIKLLEKFPYFYVKLRLSDMDCLEYWEMSNTSANIRVAILTLKIYTVAFVETLDTSNIQRGSHPKA